LERLPLRADLSHCRQLPAPRPRPPIETHEGWLEATRYLNMEHLKERKKEALRAIAA
jgi:hypothetical protein